MTNNAKAPKQVKKNPLDIDKQSFSSLTSYPIPPSYVFRAGKYRLWERLRRERFNAGLESLSASLPDYEAGVSKWTKGDIVERALNYIKALQAQRIPDDLQKRIKGLKRQNSKLREIIRSKLAQGMDPKEFSKLNLQEIQSLITSSVSEEAFL
ncbi:Uncharacterized protein FKW44_023243 [Caligus rogercresseyi]|uniref:BHLH domain-containing protein n=1 Tax=Caligus rogercresseyi TaxID=217165 RepID=A0A7T8JUK8_CALRO|nr:Uncharacterized protein FKW44_023243 [Caligus rogercresseyi]